MLNVSMPVEQGFSGFWGPVSASIDWCEPNYVHSQYVAEMGNSISNLPFILLPCLLPLQCWVLQPGMRVEKRTILLALFEAITGIGSTIFHATLTFSGQLCDELGMLLLTTQWLYCVAELDAEKPKYPALPACLTAFCVVWTLNSFWLHLYYPLVFEVLFISAISATVVLLIVNWRSLHPLSRRAIIAGGLFMAAGFVTWLSDNNFCHCAWHPTKGFFHSLWHVFMSLYCYTCYITEVAERSKPLRQTASIRYCLLVVPYVHLEENEKKVQQTPRVEHGM